MPLEHETEKLFTAPTPPLAHGPDHAQARALALQVVPPTAYHAQFSVEQRAAYNLAQAYLALAPQPSAPPQERVSEAVREVLSRCEDFRRNPSASGTANATFEHIAQILTAALAPPQERVSEAMVERAASWLRIAHSEVGWVNEDVRDMLTAAMSAGRGE
jgi:hypothetical protein